jgi:hypothetical protein
MNLLREKKITCPGIKIRSISKMDTRMFVIMQCTILQASCRAEVNECHNGGTMIWDTVKPFACLCKEGYEGEFCEKGNTDSAVASPTI